MGLRNAKPKSWNKVHQAHVTDRQIGLFLAYGSSKKGIAVPHSLAEYVWFLSKLDKNYFLFRNEYGSLQVCLKLPITTDLCCNWTPFGVTLLDFLAEINTMFFFLGVNGTKENCGPFSLRELSRLSRFFISPKISPNILEMTRSLQQSRMIRHLSFFI